MKTIYKALITLAASFALAPAVSAQTVDPEKYTIKNGVGYNKYLMDTKPNADGEYTLRIETFVTGSVKSTAVPTDFVLVLDASGSMEYDYRPGGVTMPMNDESNAATWSKIKDYFVPIVGTDDKFSHLSIYYTWAAGDVGSTGVGSTPSASGSHKGTRSNYPHFVDEDGSATCSIYYHYDDGTSNTGYYKVFRRMFDAEDGCLLQGPALPTTDNNKDWKKYAGTAHTGTPTTLSARPATVWYNLAIRLKDGTYKYLNGSGLTDTPSNTYTGVNTILFINDGNLCRIQRRREALIDGVESFVNLIAEENAKDQWADNIPAKHQLSIVRFSAAYASGGPSITPPTGYNHATHVMNYFTEINGATEAADFNANFEDHYIVNGSTYTDYGMHLARMLMQDLNTKEGGKYAALNSSGGVLRNKVVVFFTDGEPSNSTHGGGTSDSFFGTVTPTLRDGKYVKQVGVGKINARIYCIDLAMTTNSKAFLNHLSSNYPKGDSSRDYGTADNTKYTGSIVPISKTDETFTEDEYNFLKDETPIYYKDANDGDLKSVFSSIAAGNVGQKAGQNLVMMDVMSDSFEIPENAGDKIKLYTAQCIGTKQIDGEDYLAFAEPIPAGSRDALEHIWVYRKEGEAEDAPMSWVDLAAETSGGYVVDGALSARKAEDGKNITIYGFDFADMWCGLDEIEDHYSSAPGGNTRQEIAATDPNAGYAADGYRGFKVIIEFPIIVSPGAVGGSGVPTNKERESGFYQAGDDNVATGDPIINYQKPQLTIPVMLAVQKEGLGPNESASFTVQMKKIDGSDDWHDYATFVLTCTEDDNKPIQKLINLDPDYYYRIKENNWSWAYSNKAQVEATFPSTDPNDPNYVNTNPIVIVNTPIPNPPKHAEAVSRNDMHNYSE